MSKGFVSEMTRLGAKPIKVKASAKQILVTDINDDAENVANDINAKKVEKVTASSSVETPKVEDPKPEAPAIDIQAIVQAAVGETIAALKSSSEQQLEAVRNEFDQKIQAASEQIEAERSAAEAFKDSLAEAATKLEAEKAANQRLSEALKLQGSSEVNKFPNVNTVSTTDSDSPVGILAEAVGIIESTLIEKVTPEGEISRSFDYRQFDSFVKQNRKQIIGDLEISFKKNGFLRGKDPTQVKAAATLIGDLPGAFLEVLSSLVRQTHRSNLIHHQFCPTQMNFAKAAGTTVDLYRSAYLPSTSNPADFLVGDGTAYADLSADGQAIQTGIIQARLKEYALGKVGTNMKPITIPTFVMAYSMIDLLNITNRNLGRTYFEHEDLQIRSLWKPTSRVLYHNDGEVTTAPLDIVATSIGTFTRRLVTALFEYCYSSQFMPFPDGSYMMTLVPKAAKQLKDSFDDKWQANTTRDLEELMDMLIPTEYPGESDGRISGYLGKYEGIHFFEHNTYGVGAAGTEGVQDVTTGAGSKLTRSNYLFGMDSIGRGIGDPMRIVENEVTNYGRKSTFVWMETAAYVAKDVDPTGYNDTSEVPQQLRVIEVRTLDVAI